MWSKCISDRKSHATYVAKCFDKNGLIKNTCKILGFLKSNVQWSTQTYEMVKSCTFHILRNMCSPIYKL